MTKVTGMMDASLADFNAEAASELAHKYWFQKDITHILHQIKNAAENGSHSIDLVADTADVYLLGLKGFGVEKSIHTGLKKITWTT